MRVPSLKQCAIALRMRKHKAALDTIENGLEQNVFQDILYEDFPNVTSGTISKTYSYDDLELRAIATFHPDRCDISLRMKRDGKFIGTLVRRSSQKRFLILPENRNASQEIDALVAALQEVAQYDEQSRGGSLSAA
jgi:hypothetical protein